MMAFDEMAWCEKCEQLAKQMQAGCGLVYELYQRRLSAGIDALLARLPEEQRREAIRLSRAKFGYMSPEEVAEDIRRDMEAGYCCHGLDPYYCPAGCGDFDEYEAQDWDSLFYDQDEQLG